MNHDATPEQLRMGDGEVRRIAVQEYFQALRWRGRPVEELIPAEGVPAAHREAVIFLAGTMDDATSLVARAKACGDVGLAYALLREAPRNVDPVVVLEMARHFWIRAVSDSSFVGEQRREATAFAWIATLLEQDVETLAHALTPGMNTTDRVRNLSRFYGQLGDREAMRRVLAGFTDDAKTNEILFPLARVAYQFGEHSRAVELYSRYLNAPGLTALNQSAAHGNRALSLQKLGQYDKALADHRRAIELYERPSQLSNMALLLLEMQRRAEAIAALERALSLDPGHARTHSALADALTQTEPERALHHYERAVEHASHDEHARIYLTDLAALQTRLERHMDAARSYHQLIALDPTSENVRTWKRQLAHHRNKHEEALLARSARERLLEDGSLPLTELAREWLRVAGFALQGSSATWLTVSSAASRQSVPVVLILDPEVTAAKLREALDALPPDVRGARDVLLVTAAEILPPEARTQLAAFQDDDRRVALVTAIEVRDAWLQGPRLAHELYQSAFRVARAQGDPFSYVGPVKEHAQFFGREGELRTLATILGNGGHVGLYGIHKIGKSSLLEEIRRKLHLRHPNVTVVPVELRAKMDSSALYREVLERLPEGEDPGPGPHTADTFRRALEAFHRRTEARRAGHRVLVILDEYAYMLPPRSGPGGMHDFLEVLGVFKVMVQEGWFSLLPCGRTAALSQLASWGEQENPFVALITPYFVGPLSREENDDMMKTLAIYAKLSFTDDGLAAVYEWTGGHPQFSRDLGAEILRQGHAPADAARVYKAAGSLIASPFRVSILRAIYEERLDDDERSVVRLLALEGPQPKRLFTATEKKPADRLRVRNAIENLVHTTVLVEREGVLDHRYGLLRSLIQRSVEEDES